MLLLFEDCVLDLDRRELRRASRAVAVPPLVFDLVAYLAQRCDRVVGKDDLIAALWNGRIISDSTLASHINAARKALGDDGQQQRMLRTVARKGFRFVAAVREVESLDADAGPAAVTASPSPALPDKPSIAVLPFINLSGDPAQEYLVDGVVGDIIAAMSRYRWLFVVARNSSFTYKGRVVDIKQVGRELGVRYVLEGSWRKAGNRVRITGQLIDAGNGAHLWADHFEGVLDDIFALQDQIAGSVVGAIAPELERAEIERTRHKPTASLNAYDYYLRGMAALHHGTRASADDALAMFHKAIAFDPAFASAHAMAAWCFCWRKANGWMDDRAAESAEGLRLARRAMELDKGDAVALTRSGHALGYLADDLQGGSALLDRALVLNPNLAAAWFLGGWLKIWLGDTDAAITYLTRALRLSPLDPEAYRMQAGMAVAQLFNGQFETAAAWAEKAHRDLPNFLLAAAILAASKAQAGSLDEARHVMTLVRALDPALRVSTVPSWLPIRRAAHLALLNEGLRKAGLPE